MSAPRRSARIASKAVPSAQLKAPRFEELLTISALIHGTKHLNEKTSIINNIVRELDVQYEYNSRIHTVDLMEAPETVKKIMKLLHSYKESFELWGDIVKELDDVKKKLKL